MNKFWQWMEKKEYGKMEYSKMGVGTGLLMLVHNPDVYKKIVPPYTIAMQQMLIGYMIEYLEEKDQKILKQCFDEYSMDFNFYTKQFYSILDAGINNHEQGIK